MSGGSVDDSAFLLPIHLWIRSVLRGEPIHLSVVEKPSPDLNRAHEFSVSYPYHTQGRKHICLCALS